MHWFNSSGWYKPLLNLQDETDKPSICWSVRTLEPVHEKTNNLGFRPGPTQTRLYSHRSRLEAWNFGFKKKRDCTIRVAKTKALISFAVTAKLICVFVFAYADCWFSHAQAHFWWKHKITKYGQINTPQSFSMEFIDLNYAYSANFLP